MNKNERLTLGSLFDGSGGFPLAGIISGITPVWSSEVEPFAIRVTTKRLPQMLHFGDVSEMNGGEIPPVDIITAGSPCQDMSIAGRRDGLEGSRSSLFYESIRIVKEMREKTNGEKPRFFVWENVPGAFSSNKGQDFKAVLEAVIGVKEPTAEVPAPEKKGWPNADYYVGDGWSVAYRVLDAQWWGVPQRRQRIFLVADFAGERAPEILFESEGLSGYSAEGFRSWQRAAGDPAEGTGETGGRAGGLILNDQGGNRMDVTEDVTCTLRAEAHHPPVVLDEPKSAGFCTEHSARSRGIGYEEETSPTLRAGVVPAAIALEHHPTDSRIKIEEGNAIQTLTSRMGTGGNNVPLVMTPSGPLTPKTLKIRSGKEGGGKGPLIQEDMSATLGTNNDQTLFVPVERGYNWDGSQTSPTLTVNNADGRQHMPDKAHMNCVVQPVAFGISSMGSNGMKSDNPKVGFYEAETSKTLDISGGNPSCNQGGVCVVANDPAYALQGSMIGRKLENGPQGSGVNEEVSFTLDAADRHAVAYGIDRAAFNQGQNAKFGFQVEEEVEPTMVSRGPNAVASPAFSASKASFFTEASEEMANTLVASDYKDPPIVNDMEEPHYIVRRLTPVECARLQGFPDWWCSGLENENPTEKDICFWAEVWETHRKLVGKSTKPKTEKQIIKWLKDPHSDAAEYKLWGNGICLPIAVFVLSGIVWAADEPVIGE